MTVIAFAPRPKDVPALTECDLYLNPQTCAVEMRLTNEDGAVVVLHYSLTKSPEGFDLDLLRQAWTKWREESEVAN